MTGRAVEERKKTALQRLKGGPPRWVFAWASALFLAALWGAVALFYEPKDLPGPIEVAQTLAGNLLAPHTYYHLGLTLLRILAGFFLSMALGFSLGVLMGGRREFEAFFDVWLVVGLAMPAPAWAMISVLLFGLNQAGTVVAITLLAAPFVTIGIWQGVKALDMGLIEMARAFGVSRQETFRHVLLPQLTPFLLAAARYGFGLCWKVTVLVEMIGLGDGVGNVMDDAFHNFEMEQVLAWTVLFTLVMLGIEAGIWKSFERRATRWRPALHLA